MNILLWVLQALLALWNLIGGVFTMFNYEQLKSVWAGDLPKLVWVALSVFQVLFALGLILPGLDQWVKKMIPISAVYLALNALLGCVLFAKYAGFPGCLWGVIPALLLAFVAYGRFSLKPL